MHDPACFLLSLQSFISFSILIHKQLLQIAVAVQSRSGSAGLAVLLWMFGVLAARLSVKPLTLYKPD